jgi:dephospho-CoA kinase
MGSDYHMNPPTRQPFLYERVRDMEDENRRLSEKIIEANKTIKNQAEQLDKALKQLGEKSLL